MESRRRFDNLALAHNDKTIHPRINGRKGGLSSSSLCFVVAIITREYKFSKTRAKLLLAS